MKKKLNQQALWRYELALNLFSKIRDKSNLISFFVGGSVARNLADAYSDLEICFVWKNSISERKRKKLYLELGFEKIELNLVDNNEEPYEDTIYLNQLQIDIWHLNELYVRQLVQEVIFDFSTNLSKSNLIETFQSCIPIYGNKFISKINTQTSVYPEELSKKMILNYSKDFFKANLKMFIARKEWVILNGLNAGYIKLLFVLIEVINGRYHSGFKRMSLSLKKMEFLPKDILIVFEDINSLDAVSTYQKLYKLKGETIKQIKIKFPTIDLSYIEANKKNKRQVLND